MASSYRQHPIAFHLLLSHWGPAAAVPFQFLLSVSTQLKCSREIFGNRLFAHLLSPPGCLSFPAASAYFCQFPCSRQSLCLPKMFPAEFFCTVSLCFMYLEPEQANIHCFLQRTGLVTCISFALIQYQICTVCSPEILISTGNSPVEPGTQENTQLSLLQLSHLNIFWLDLCFAFLENFSLEHQMGLYFFTSFHPVPCKNTLGEFNRSHIPRVTSKVVISPQNFNIGVCFYCG